MKKLLFKSLFVASLFLSIKTINAQCSLDQVGAVNYVTTSQLSDVAIAPNKVVYTISFNTSTGKYQLYSGMTASSWTLTATLTGSTTIKPVIHINKAGKVSIFVRDDNAGGVGKVYVLNTGTLIQQGANVTTGAVNNLCITSDPAGDEYIAYTDVPGGNKSFVKKWNSGSSVWTPVGGSASPGAGAYNSLVVTGSDMPALAFQDGTQANKTSVMKFNGSIWVSIGILGGNATNSKLKLASNGDLYLGYTETGGNTVVQKFDGASWTPVGSAIPGLSSINAFDLELDPVDVPYITGILSTPPYPVAYKFTGVPTWSNVIGSGYLNSATSLNPNIKIDYTGTPYFFYVDQPANNALNVKTLTSALSISPQPVSISRCNGQSGSFNVGVVGGTALGYQWKAASVGTFTNAGTPYLNGTTNTLSFTAATAMNQNKVLCIVNAGCKNIVSNTATLTVVTPSSNLITTNPTCFGSCNGLITSSPSGGTGPYTFTWTPGGASSQNLSGACAGNYSLTTADASGCTVSVMGTLINPPSISTSFSGNMTICNGSNTTLTVTASNGVPAYTYSWSPGATLSSTTSSVVTANPTSSQTYNVQVTDANGCVATNTVMITVNPLPSVSAGLDNTICNGGSTMNTATGAHTYTWNPGNFVGANQNVTPFSTTSYTVVGTNTLTGCSTSDVMTVFVNPLPIANAGPTRTLTCANTSTTLAGSGGGTYSWTGPGIIAGVTSASPTINMPGTYSLVVNVSGCTSTVSTVIVSQNTVAPSITAANSGPITCSSPTVSLNGTPGTGVTYLWSGPGITGPTTTQNTTANAAGNYTLQVVSTINGCIGNAITTVSQNTSPPTAFATNSGTLTCSTPTMALSGTGGGTYNWSGPGIVAGFNTANPIINLPGCYNLTVTNVSNGCTATANTCVSQNTIAPATNTNVSGTLNCTLTSVNASATTTVTPVSYNWSGTGITSASNISTITVNAGGIKNYTVTNTSNGCYTSGTVAVAQNTTIPSGLSAGFNQTLTCASPSVILNGSITTPTNAAFNWAGGVCGSTNALSTAACTASVYTLTATNPLNGCAASSTVAVFSNTAIPTINVGGTPTITCASSTVTLTTSSSADPVSTYSWTSPFAGMLNNYNVSNPIASAGGVFTVVVTNTLNGCAAMATVVVFVDQAIPTVSLSSNSSTITCSSPTTSVSVSTTPSSNVVYSWTPTGPSFSAPGTYSLVVTNTVNGCSTSSAANVVSIFQDQSIPTVSLSANSATLTCLTPTVMVTSTVTPSSNVIFSWSPSAGISSPTNQSNATFTAAGIYSLVVTNTVNGCASSNTFMVITDNVSPSITITGNTTICKGSTTNLAASGATSYTWNTGTNTSTISVTPTTTTTYTLTGDNGNGCSSSVMITVSIIPAKNISGVITSTTGATTGDVILYKYVSALSQWDSVTTVPFAGSYSFAGIDSALYVVRAIPTATNIQVTYGDSAISWQDATVINHGCANNSLQNIKLIALENFIIGPGVLTGTITEGNGFGQRMNTSFKTMAPGNPIGGIIVKGGKNPGGQMFVQTLTDEATGTYTLSGLPLNTGSESYFIYVDIPGLDTNGTYHVVVSSGNTQFNNLNFYVDSMYIHPNTVTFIQTENILLENKIIVYPNPAQQFTSIQYELLQPTDVSIDIHDVVGNKIESVLSNAQQEKNKYTHRINTSSLSSGVYLINLKINNSQTVIKLIVTE